MPTPLPVRNHGDGLSFFERMQKNPNQNYLLNDQIDPTQPQIQGLSRVSGPAIPIDHVSDMVKNFDPDLYDLRPTSHLMRLISALCGAPGVGGLRKQYTTTRLSSTLTSANFVDLDAFYGALFNLQRHVVERMPTNLDGSTVNPMTDSAHSDIWDDILSRDARYRSRIVQLSRAINMGATYSGLKGAAEAVLGCEVDLTESWVNTDQLNNSSGITLPTGQTFGQITAQRVTYGNVLSSYNVIEGHSFGSATLPAGNRGELVFTPRKIIGTEDQYQLTQVLETLRPSNCQVTISSLQSRVEVPVAIRGLASDSEYWNVQTRITPANNLIQPTTPLYKNAGPSSEARPAFSEYSGESWTYNTNVTKVLAYQMDRDFTTSLDDVEAITYADGTNAFYRAEQAIMNARIAISERLSAQGIVTSAPYAGSR